MTDTDIDGLVKQLEELRGDFLGDGLHPAINRQEIIQALRKVAELGNAASELTSTNADQNSRIAELEKERDRLILAIADHQTVRSEYVGRIAKLEKENYEWCISNERISNQCCELEAQIAASRETPSYVWMWSNKTSCALFESEEMANAMNQGGASTWVQPVRVPVFRSGFTSPPVAARGEPFCFVRYDEESGEVEIRDPADPRNKDLIALFTAPVAVPEWQPIETAPTGSNILVYTPNERQKIHAACWMENYKTIGGAFAFDLTKPTHWMPLPAAPTKEQTK